mmetsp:Transcript_9183/g.33656  ORF Transcript_9183/g.33656 Transcript_9183/m.33656 type:complete len:272 (-) Transcript_9183:4399-5214(-)
MGSPSPAPSAKPTDERRSCSTSFRVPLALPGASGPAAAMYVTTLALPARACSVPLGVPGSWMQEPVCANPATLQCGSPSALSEHAGSSALSSSYICRWASATSDVSATLRFAPPSDILFVSGPRAVCSSLESFCALVSTLAWPGASPAASRLMAILSMVPTSIAAGTSPPCFSACAGSGIAGTWLLSRMDGDAFSPLRSSVLSVASADRRSFQALTSSADISRPVDTRTTLVTSCGGPPPGVLRSRAAASAVRTILCPCASTELKRSLIES